MNQTIILDCDSSWDGGDGMQGGRSAEGGGRKECRRGRGDAGGRSAEGGEGMGGKECRKGRGDADFQNSMTSQFTVLVLES